jgi:type I restriction enzyme S subunit
VTLIERKIGDDCLVGDGAHAKIQRQTSGVLYLTCKNFKNGNLDISKVDYISEEDYSKYFREESKALTKPQTGDVVFSIIGTIGEPYLYQQKDRFGISSSVSILRPDVNIVNPNYLYYWIKSDILQNALYGIKGGVAQGYVSLEMIKSLPFYYPPLPTQQRIAEILSKYDNLIDNNNRRIGLLEEFIHLLYKEWFVRLRFPGYESVKVVDGIPEGWNRVPATEVIDFNPKTSAPKGEVRPYLPMEAVSTNSMILTGIDTRLVGGGAKFKNGDTLLARITPCLENGKTAFVQFMEDDNMVATGSTEFIVMRSTQVTPYWVYCLARSHNFRQHAINSMAGSDGRQRVKSECFDQYTILCSPPQIIKYFDTIAAPMFKQIKYLNSQNQKLKEARDLLLPRLMNGSIAV